MTNGLSRAGRHIANKFPLDDSSLAFEVLGHDGYDSDGPKSDLWDLYIIHLDSSTVDVYHREDWYTGSAGPYQLVDSGLSLNLLFERYLPPYLGERLIDMIRQRKNNSPSFS